MAVNKGQTVIRSTVPSWLVSWPMIVGCTIFLCGTGLILLWLRPTTSTKAKVVTTAVISAGFAIVVVAAATSPTPNGGASMATSAQNTEPETAPSLSLSSDMNSVPIWARPELADNEYLADLSPYVATVVGYGDPDSFTNDEDITWIQLTWTRKWTKGLGDSEEVESEEASEAVKLAMVMPYEPAVCGGVDPDAARKAQEALERILPIGSTVLSIRSESLGRDEDRFLHVLTGPTATPDPAPPAGSANEALVASGTWVPEYFYYYDDRPYVASSVSIIGPKFQAPQAITEYDAESVYFDDEEEYGREYSDRIIAAANTALRNTPDGQSCQSAYAAYVEQEVKDAKKNDREWREWQLQVERERKTWTCIDGDGDGICFE